MKSAEFLELIKSRRSIRKFKLGEIPQADIETAIIAGGFAPSNGNSQPWRFVYVKDQAVKRELGEMVKNKLWLIEKSISNQDWKEEFKAYAKYLSFFVEAPGLIVAVYKKNTSLLQHFVADEKLKAEIADIPSGISSVSAAIENILLMLHSMGYGACWTTGPLVARNEMADYLKILPPFEIAALIPFGLPDEQPTILKKKNLDKILVIR